MAGQDGNSQDKDKSILDQLIVPSGPLQMVKSSS